MLLLQADQFWTGVVRLPRVKPAMLEAVLLHEIGKVYPGTIAASTELRWECLDGLFGARGGALQAFLVQIPLVQGIEGMSGLQCLVRLASRQKGIRPKVLAVLSVEGVEILGYDLSGQVAYHAGGHGDVLHMLSGMADGSNLCLRHEPGLRIDEADRVWRYIEVGSVSRDRLTREPLRNDGQRQAVFWRRLAIGGVVACLLLLASWALRGYTDRQAQLSALRGQVIKMQQKVQVDTTDAQERRALEKDIASLEKRTPVEMYRLLQTITEQLDAADRILMVRWDAENRTMTLELASKQAINLLDRLSKARVFVKLTSGGMAPLSEDAAYMRFIMTGYLEAP